jgi:hypothetical protein
MFEENLGVFITTNCSAKPIQTMNKLTITFAKKPGSIGSIQFDVNGENHHADLWLSRLLTKTTDENGRGIFSSWQAGQQLAFFRETAAIVVDCDYDETKPIEEIAAYITRMIAEINAAFEAKYPEETRSVSIYF